MHTLRQLLGNKTAEVYSVAPNDSVIDAIRLMAQKGVGAVLVMEGAKLVGIISERDYARKVVLHGRSSADTAVREIMTAEVVTVGPVSYTHLDVYKRQYWHKDAETLSAAESARLAAVLPSPRRYSVSRPGPYVQRRANWIQRQSRQIGGTDYLETLD